MVILFERSYSLNLPAYAYDNQTCLNQVTTLEKSARRFLELPSDKSQFKFENEKFVLQTANNDYPIEYSVKRFKSETSEIYIAKKDASENCVFSARPK